MKVLRSLGSAKTRKKRRSLVSGPPREKGAWARRTWWTVRGVGLGMVVLGAGIGLRYGWERSAELPALAVTKVEVEGNRVVAGDEIRRLAGVPAGESLLRLDLDRIRRGVLRHPYVTGTVVTRKLPDTLRISVRERLGRALLVQDGGFALVDGEGIVLSRDAGGAVAAAGGRYPLISGIVRGYRPGETAAEARPALAALAALENAGRVPADGISEMTVAGDGRILVSLTGSGTVLVMKNSAPVEQARRFARLLAGGAFDIHAAGYDLRFDDRVVRLPDRYKTPGEINAGRKNQRQGGENHGQD